MILALCFPTFAAEVEVPVTAYYREVTEVGQDPLVVDDVRSASIGVTDPTTGATLTTRGELFAVARVGQGTGELSFSSRTNGTLHTWAIYLLDTAGNPLTAEPQVVDVLFGAGGDGTITARAEADIVIKQVRIKKRGVSSRADDDGGSELTVEVQGLGTEAAYVGVVELAADGAPLLPHVDMEAMTADVYASYQGLALDVIVPLDEWATRLEGTVSVEGVSTEGNQLQGGADLDYAVTLLGTASKTGSSVLGDFTLSAYAPLQPAADADLSAEVIPAGGLWLESNDRDIDVYDGSMDVIIAGDARHLELAAAWVPVGSALAPTSPELLSFDPSSAGVSARALGTVKYPSEDTYSAMYLSVQPVGKEGNALEEARLCRLELTAGSRYGSTLSYVGECERNADERVDTRAITAQITRTGALNVALTWDSLPLQSATSALFTLQSTSGATLWTGSGAAAISNTTFTLDWSFAEAPNGEAADLELYLYGTSTPQSVTLVSAGWTSFKAGRGTWSSGSDETGVYAKDIVALRDVKTSIDKIEVSVDVDVK